MTAEELTAIRKGIKFDKTSMSLCLGIPKTTYQRYEDRSASIPEQIARKVLEIRQINVTFTATMPERIDAAIQKYHPYGIISDVDREWA